MKIGTRGSQLALWQARLVAARIEERGGPHCELVIIRTSGDEPPDAPGETRAHGDERSAAATAPDATPLNVKRMFVKEIEEALLDGRVDLAVHSSKDLPVVLPDGLEVAAVLPREDPRDALSLPNAVKLGDVAKLRHHLGPRPRIGTSSVRRIAQLRTVFPNASFVPIRGNVDTRLGKLDAGECDAIVLAAAGLKRLGSADRISLTLPIETSVPAPGQGIVAIEVSSSRRDVIDIVAAINDRDAIDALRAERAVVATLGGGCQMPLGVLAEAHGPILIMRAIVIASDARRVLREETRGLRQDAVRLGESLGRALLAKGAAEILEQSR